MARKRMTVKARAKRAARRLPVHMQDIAFTKFKGRYHKMKLGKLGAASEVRHIDPAEYQGEL